MRPEAATWIQRKNQEKVRATYDFSHRLTKDGAERSSAAGAAGGSVPQLGAAVELHKVNNALGNFDAAEKTKNAELFEKLHGNLGEIAACEVKYYDNDECCARYGEVFNRFMPTRYSA